MSVYMKPQRNGNGHAHPAGSPRARKLRLDRTGAEPLHAQLKRALIEQILDSTYKAGEQLPTEMELVARHGISRITVRRTLAELTNEGFVQRRAGVGTIVRPRVYWDRRSDRLYGFYEEMRAQGLEAHAEIIWVSHGRSTQRDEEALGIPARTWVARVRQLGFVDEKPLAVADVTLGLPAGMQLSAKDVVGEPTIYPFLERHFGITFGDAEKVLSAEPAGDEDAAFLEIAPGTPVLVAEVTARLDRPAAAMFIRTRYRGDRYRYAVALHN